MYICNGYYNVFWFLFLKFDRVLIKLMEFNNDFFWSEVKRLLLLYFEKLNCEDIDNKVDIIRFCKDKLRWKVKWICFSLYNNIL